MTDEHMYDGARGTAISVLTKYFRMILDNAGRPWSAEDDTNVAALVDGIVNAAQPAPVETPAPVAASKRGK